MYLSRRGESESPPKKGYREGDLLYFSLPKAIVFGIKSF